MDQAQQVQDDVEAVSQPEELVCLLADQRVSEDKYDDHHDEQHHTCDT